jgi:hypothetical protein
VDVMVEVKGRHRWSIAASGSAEQRRLGCAPADFAVDVMVRVQCDDFAVNVMVGVKGRCQWSTATLGSAGQSS